MRPRRAKHQLTLLAGLYVVAYVDKSGVQGSLSLTNDLNGKLILLTFVYIGIGTFSDLCLLDPWQKQKFGSRIS
jgi:hypothetical protein